MTEGYATVTANPSVHPRLLGSCGDPAMQWASSALTFALVGCSTLYPSGFHVLREGPVRIGPAWTEIHCPEVVTTTLPDKELWLLLPRTLVCPGLWRQGGGLS